MLGSPVTFTLLGVLGLKMYRNRIKHSYVHKGSLHFQLKKIKKDFKNDGERDLSSHQALP